MALQAGHLFGNYRIVRLLGEGGFGEVYLAENPLIERRAAVKVLHTAMAQDAELVRRFLNEARAASAIRHRNIIEVFDAGVTPEGAPYILMEFLEGVSLQKRLADRRRLALPQVLEIARQAGSALAAAHAAGIVHRDLKPENLFLVPDASAPGGERVKILDFGIAKIKRSSGRGATLRTQAGLIMGSPAYMSPEQCKDSADVDLRSDIYSFAIIVYEMLAGRTPYVAESGTEMLLMHLTNTPPPLRSLVANLPSHVEAAVKRGLARARADRFDSMASFVGALRGERGGAAHGLGRTSPSDELAVVGESLLSRVGRTVPAQASTTFSRATGEAGAALGDEEDLPAKQPRRWHFLAFGAAAVAGVASFLLVRPSHESAPRLTPGTLRIAAADAGRAAPVATARPDAAPVAVLPSKADSGVAPPVATGAQPSPKPAPAAAVAAPVGRRRAKLQEPKAPPAQPAVAPSSSPSLPPAPPRPDNPAGF